MIDDFDSEILFKRAKHIWPWTVRPAIREIWNSFDNVDKWRVIGGHEIYRMGGLHVVLTWWNPRIHEPHKIKLTMREGLLLRKGRRRLVKIYNLIELELISRGLK